MMNGGGMARMSVLERQQARMMQWQDGLPPPLQQQQMGGIGYFGSVNNDQLSSLFSLPVQPLHFHGLTLNNDQNLGGILGPSGGAAVNNQFACSPGGGGERADGAAAGFMGFNGCELGNVTGNIGGLNYGVSRTTSCPPAVAAALAEVASAATKRKENISPEKLSSSAGRDSFKKRKSDKTQPPQKVAAEEQSKDNKRKLGSPEADEESKVTEQKGNKTEPSENSKENSKFSEVQKPDYIHVRARRGQATDSHSLAERVRREKISERMKYLQDLVPGCNKITGKAGMLDEIINYVQSLQRQVEFLSMKLAAVNPRLDVDIDNIFSKEIFSVGMSEPHIIEESTEMNNPPNYHFASLEQLVSSCSALETDKNLPDMALRRTISAPVSLPDTLIDSPYFTQIQPYSTWDTELQTLYGGLEFQQGRSATLLPCTGFDIGSNVKIEM